MGIRGLTQFIQNRSHQYMENYQLHNTCLIIDGNSVAHQLYRQCYSNDCFGGDYDKFGQVVLNFFHLLFECDIIPYVIFDGGYENRKVVTVISRMKNKIESAEQLDSVTEGSLSVFPLFLRDVFQEIVNKLNIKAVRCDFESDTETASIARTLNCPVLSYDSDYFVLDVKYIPFNTFEMCVKRFKDEETKKTYKYISCKLYMVEKFLTSFGGLDKRNLPILAVLLGNDYVKRKVFALFFQNLKMQKSQGKSEQQRRIKSVIVWLQNETFESALKVILNRYKKVNRPKVLNKIENAMKGYFLTNSKYLEYLGISYQKEDIGDSCIDFSKLLSESLRTDLNSIDNKDSDDESIQSDDSNTVSIVSEGDETFENDNSPVNNVESTINSIHNVPDNFLYNFRKCTYPSCFIDILVNNQYYCIPQVENSTLDFAHNISFFILGTIHKILTNSPKNLVCVCRIENHVGRRKVPLCNVKVPLYSEIYNMCIEDKTLLFIKILKINMCHLKDYVNLFPENWHIFIMSIIYFMEKSACTWSLISSFLLVKLVLSVIDKKIGFYRTKKQFDKFYAKVKLVQNVEVNVTDDVQTALSYISYNDSVEALKNLIVYFEMDQKMTSHRKLFDRNLVHSMSQFQSILLHVSYLNKLLNFPFSDLLVSDTLNCTFVYNFSVNLKKRTNIENYIELILNNSPTILNCFKLMINKLKEYFPQTSTTDSTNKKRRKKRKVKEMFTDNSTDVCTEDDESSYDPNNKFSVLFVNEK